MDWDYIHSYISRNRLSCAVWLQVYFNSDRLPQKINIRNTKYTISFILIIFLWIVVYHFPILKIIYINFLISFQFKYRKYKHFVIIKSFFLLPLFWWYPFHTIKQLLIPHKTISTDAHTELTARVYLYNMKLHTQNRFISKHTSTHANTYHAGFTTPQFDFIKIYNIIWRYPVTQININKEK